MYLSGSFYQQFHSLESRMEAMEGFDISSLESRITAAENSLTNKSDVGHTHDWSVITGKPTIPTITAQTHIADAATTAPTNAASNSPNNAPTNLNVVTTLLGALTGEVNATNTRQNQIADIVNANAVKQNTIGTIVVSIAQKLNLNFDALEANGILASS